MWCFSMSRLAYPPSKGRLKPPLRFMYCLYLRFLMMRAPLTSAPSTFSPFVEENCTGSPKLAIIFRSARMRSCSFFLDDSPLSSCGGRGGGGGGEDGGGGGGGGDGGGGGGDDGGGGGGGGSEGRGRPEEEDEGGNMLGLGRNDVGGRVGDEAVNLDDNLNVVLIIFLSSISP